MTAEQIRLIRQIKSIATDAMTTNSRDISAWATDMAQIEYAASLLVADLPDAAVDRS